MLERQLGSAFARQAGLNDDGIGPVFLHRCESGLKLLTAADPDRVDCSSGGFAAICSRKGLEKGSVALARAVTRRAGCSMSRSSCTLLAASSAATDGIPVTFPPGRGRLATSPVPTGSPVSAMTIGISRVACFAARAVGVNQVTMTSTLRRTSSAANSGSPVEVSSRRSKLKSNVLPLDIPQIAQPLPKLPPKLFRIDIANDQCADGRHFARLLRACRERPSSRRAAKRADEFSPPDVNCHVTLPRGSCPRNGGDDSTL